MTRKKATVRFFPAILEASPEVRLPISIRVHIDSKTRAALDRMNPEAVNRGIADSVRGYAILLNRSLRENAQKSLKPGITGRSGNFARGWVATARQFVLTVFNRVSYAPFVEFGTGLFGPKRARYEIKPRFKKVLRWRTGGRGPISAFRSTRALAPGNFAFAMKVNHPGSKGKFVFTKTVRGTLDQYANILKEKIENVFKA